MNVRLHSLCWLFAYLVLQPSQAQAESPDVAVAQALLQRADAHLSKAAYEPALELLSSAYDIGVALDNAEIIRSALNSVANVSYSTGNLDLAHKYFSMLANQDMASGKRKDLAVSLFKLGHVNASRQDFRQADENFMRSLQISRELNDTAGVAYTLKVLGVNAEAQGNMTAARDYLLESLQLFASIAESRQVAGVRRHLGDVALESAEYEHAILQYSTALDTLDQDEIPGPALTRTYRGLSKAHAYLHNYQAAYAFHLVYTQLLQDQHQQQGREMTRSLQVKFESQRLFDDNERLRLLSESQQRELRHRNDVQRMQLVVIVLAFGILALIGALWHRSRQTARNMEHLATTDALTGLLNRRAVIQHGETEWKRAQRFNRTMSCIVLDVDHFKSINDTWGHATGDQVLRRVAAGVKSSLRTMDVLGRFGGEEFLVIAAETSVDQARILAERIRQTVASISHEGISDRTVSVSIGVAQLTSEISLDQLIAHADEAMYAAKNGGRNRVESYRDIDPVPATLQARLQSV